MHGIGSFRKWALLCVLVGDSDGSDAPPIARLGEPDCQHGDKISG